VSTLKIGLYALLTVVLAALAVGSTAAADPGNANSIEVRLNCPGRTLTGITIEHNNAVVFQVKGEAFVAITQSVSFVDPDTGETVVVRANPGAGHDVTTCTYMYPGFPVLVTGEFQFTGKG
jgi:hypothetical protein